MQSNFCLDPTAQGVPCESVAGTLTHFSGTLPDGQVCTTVFNTAAGPAMTEKQICLETLGKTFTNGCASSGTLTGCLCDGTNTTMCENGTATPTGPMFDEYACDFNSTNGGTVFNDLVVQSFGAGAANQLIACAQQAGCNCF
jgi:hypothetical protein